MVFLGLNLSNISLEQDAKPLITRDRSRGVEIHELSPAGEKVCEEAPDKTSETEAGHN